MNHAIPYKIIDVPKPTLNLLKQTISSTDLEWHEGITIENSYTYYKRTSPRSSEISWITDKKCRDEFLKMALNVNKYVKWNFNIVGVEPLQFGIYPEGGYYDWHMDEHSKPHRGNVRKISMSLFLNDDYEGGEFDLELYKPGEETRFDTFKPKSGKALFFKGDQWHRVRPVTSGLRKSIVAWFYGPPYS